METKTIISNQMTPEELAGAKRFEDWMAEQDRLKENYIEPVFKIEPKKMRLPNIIEHKDEQLSMF